MLNLTYVQQQSSDLAQVCDWQTAKNKINPNLKWMPEQWKLGRVNGCLSKVVRKKRERESNAGGWSNKGRLLAKEKPSEQLQMRFTKGRQDNAKRKRDGLRDMKKQLKSWEWKRVIPMKTWLTHAEQMRDLCGCVLVPPFPWLQKSSQHTRRYRLARGWNVCSVADKVLLKKCCVNILKL
jgi:hypothetical protein